MTALTTADALRRKTPVPHVQPKLMPAARLLRQVVVAVAVLAAAFASSTCAYADPGNDTANPAPNSISGDGGVGDGIAQAGQSICPMLVQPGSDIASSATQLSGNGGLAPLIVGYVAAAAIQAQCPGFVDSVAAGNLPVSLPGMPAADAGGTAPPN